MPSNPVTQEACETREVFPKIPGKSLVSVFVRGLDEACSRKTLLVKMAI